MPLLHAVVVQAQQRVRSARLSSQHLDSGLMTVMRRQNDSSEWASGVTVRVEEAEQAFKLFSCRMTRLIRPSCRNPTARR